MLPFLSVSHDREDEQASATLGAEKGEEIWGYGSFILLVGRDGSSSWAGTAADPMEPP